MAERSRALEEVMATVFGNVYAGCRILVTGHTGFKGSWLCTWLLDLGANVGGYSIDVPSQPSNFKILDLERRLHHFWGDVRDRGRLNEVFDTFRPDCVFHLAAQPLVRRSYADPVTTFEVNTVGTMNVLECIRHRPWVECVVIITSDKCYRNHGWPWGYRETDTLGGEDPYSASKGCAELVCYAYIHSFFRGGERGARVATARAGNVIGGGDWAEDRLIPDCVRSWSRGDSVVIRYPGATRPWQHVLEPLSGYLWLGSHLLRREPKAVGASYNFGPPATVDHPVETLVRLLSRFWPEGKWTVDQQALEDRPEAAVLKLSCDKALADLRWTAVLSFEDTVRFTGEWYRRYYGTTGTDMLEFTRQQIVEYCQQAKDRGLAWTSS